MKVAVPKKSVGACVRERVGAWVCGCMGAWYVCVDTCKGA